MNYYYKKENREKFIDYWNSKAVKKLFRCAKEFGFYKELKDFLKSSYFENRNDKIKLLLAKVLANLYDNKKDLLNFEDVLPKENNLQYPVHTALTSDIHLSHVLSLYILQRCKISNRTFEEAFNWMTIEIFKDNKRKATWREIKSYIKIFFT